MTPRQLAMFLGVSAIWGASYLQIKIALDGLNAVDDRVRARRAGGGDPLLRGACARRTTGARCSFARRHPGRICMLGLLSIALPFMLISYGETQISSGLTGILVAPGPLFVALLRALPRSHRAGRPARAALGLLIGFAGVVLLLGVDTVHDPGEFLGALAVLGAACSYGLGAMYAKNAVRATPACRRS